MKHNILLFLLAGAATLYGQATGNTTIQPDCIIPFTFTAAGNFPATPTNNGPGDNRQKGCAAWTLKYQNTGMTSVSVTLQSGTSVSTTVSFGSFAGTISTGYANPIVSDTGGSLQATNGTAAISWVRVNVAATGTGTLTGVLYGFRNSSAAVNSSGGTVTNIATGCFLSGGPITTTGTIKASETVNAQSGASYAILDADCGKLVTGTNAGAQSYSIAQAGGGGSFPSGWFVDLQNRGAGTLTLTPATSTVDGAATLVLTSGSGRRLVSDGSNYFTEGSSAGALPAGSAVTDAQCWASASTFGVCANINSNLTGTVTGHASLDVPLTRTVSTSAPLGGGGALSGDLTLTCATCNTSNATVSTVGFTGGLISVANPTTTPAFTVAGTSGGIPYFSGATTWATSAAGVAGAMMAWGGAATAPTSPLSLLVTNQNAAAETWTWYNSTATTGKTAIAIRNGAGAALGDVIIGYYNNANTALGGGWLNTSTEGRLGMFGRTLCIGDPMTAANWNSCATSSSYVQITNDGVHNSSGAYFSFSSTNVATGTPDASLYREAAGIVSLNTSGSGTTAANYRSFKAASYRIAGTTFTASGCTGTPVSGGATGGTLTIAVGVCGGVTITMGNSQTATNGWSCHVSDTTTPANLWSKSGGSTTTVIFRGTAAGTDTLDFACFAY